ncbi:4173_t:CDS:2 [Ambispora gerdemannii]|uniref:4173_t:CDS:1 n=1 Tax=Ambispora gerdemannii TaxID=144530 RepID=A0A9N9FW64_9GLOM|nr:4173_t:CDS:2 [Ambispora gerdemannii]
MIENQNTNSNNALLATHEFLASEKKQKGAKSSDGKAENPIVDDRDGGMDDDRGMTEAENVQSNKSEEESSEEESSSEDEYEEQEVNKRMYLMWTRNWDEMITIKPKQKRVEPDDERIENTLFVTRHIVLFDESGDIQESSVLHLFMCVMCIKEYLAIFRWITFTVIHTVSNG